MCRNTIQILESNIIFNIFRVPSKNPKGQDLNIKGNCRLSTLDIIIDSQFFAYLSVTNIAIFYKIKEKQHNRKNRYFKAIMYQLGFQFSSVTHSCPTLCNPMNCSTQSLPIHHQVLEFTETHVHRVGDAIQPSHPLSSPSPPAPSPSQHQSLFQ